MIGKKSDLPGRWTYGTVQMLDIYHPTQLIDWSGMKVTTISSIIPTKKLWKCNSLADSVPVHYGIYLLYKTDLQTEVKSLQTKSYHRCTQNDVYSLQSTQNSPSIVPPLPEARKESQDITNLDEKSQNVPKWRCRISYKYSRLQLDSLYAPSLTEAQRTKDERYWTFDGQDIAGWNS